MSTTVMAAAPASKQPNKYDGNMALKYLITRNALNFQHTRVESIQIKNVDNTTNATVKMNSRAYTAGGKVQVLTTSKYCNGWYCTWNV